MWYKYMKLIFTIFKPIIIPTKLFTIITLEEWDSSRGQGDTLNRRHLSIIGTFCKERATAGNKRNKRIFKDRVHSVVPVWPASCLLGTVLSL